MTAKAKLKAKVKRARAKVKTTRRKRKKIANGEEVVNSRQQQMEQEDLMLDQRELISIVCEMFCQGYTVNEMRKEVFKKFGDSVEMNRERPHYLIRYAAKHGWIQYKAPSHLKLTQNIMDAYDWLKRVNVVHTATLYDVAYAAAIRLRILIQDVYRKNKKRDEVHIGFAAGTSMQILASCLADLLCEPSDDLPKRIFFHTLVTGVDPSDPTTDPNTFFTFFLYRPILQIEPKFVGLHAPTMVRRSAIRSMRSVSDIRNAIRAVSDLDIVATSGSDWDDPHSSLKRNMEQSKRSMDTLIREKVIGDLLWRPFGENGPITTETDIRAMTLLELDDLASFVENGKHVLLMLGPCAICKKDKGNILKPVLDYKRHLVSHLIMDSRTARKVA